MNMNLGYTQLIIDEAKKHGLLRNELAYVLATAYHETAHTMKPVKEAYWLSETWRKNNLRYFPWYGRGFVQLTWEINYKKAAKKLGIAMDKNPDLALEAGPAATVLVVGMKEGWFTGKKLSDFITLNKSDYKGARKIVNGTDRDMLIAEHAKNYEADLKKMGYGDVFNGVPAPVVSPTPEVSKTSVWGLLASLLASLFKGK